MTEQAPAPGGLQAAILRGHDLELTVLPGLGGKISSIRWRDEEVLARNPHKPIRPARYAAPYAEYDASGFDECLPTIAPCRYPEYPWQGVELPDHGEVWSLPWSCQETGLGLELKTHGVRLPYSFEKGMRISAPGVLDFHYTLTNLCPFPWRYLWSSHPLLALRPGMRICLPQGVSVRVDWSKDERLGELLAEHPWPVTRDRLGNRVDLSLILPEQVRLVDKLYTSRLSQGWCALYDPSSRRYAAFLFSPVEIPYVGLSINLGGWPVEGPGYYNLGLEPCSGYPDALDTAVQRGACPTLPAQAAVTWSLQLRFGEAPSQSAVEELLAELSAYPHPGGNRFDP